jgi:hypothetical protein
METMTSATPRIRRCAAVGCGNRVHPGYEICHMHYCIALADGERPPTADQAYMTRVHRALAPTLTPEPFVDGFAEDD